MISGGFGRWHCGLLGLCLLHVVQLILVLFFGLFFVTTVGCGLWWWVCNNGELWVMVMGL